LRPINPEGEKANPREEKPSLPPLGHPLDAHEVGHLLLGVAPPDEPPHRPVAEGEGLVLDVVQPRVLEEDPDQGDEGPQAPGLAPLRPLRGAEEEVGVGDGVEADQVVPEGEPPLQGL
jgi:hypothetical protein